MKQNYEKIKKSVHNKDEAEADVIGQVQGQRQMYEQL